MILGHVTDDRDPLVQLPIVRSNGTRRTVDAIVDTGFNGWLSLPAAVISSSGFRWLRLGRAILADGRETYFNVFDGRVDWDGAIVRVPVDESESDPLIGMMLMDGFELTLHAVRGGLLTLTKSTDAKC